MTFFPKTAPGSYRMNCLYLDIFSQPLSIKVMLSQESSRGNQSISEEPWGGGRRQAEASAQHRRAGRKPFGQGLKQEQRFGSGFSVTLDWLRHGSWARLGCKGGRRERSIWWNLQPEGPSDLIVSSRHKQRNKKLARLSDGRKDQREGIS